MNLIVTKMEQQFAALKTGGISAYDFFNAVWEPLAIVRGAATGLLNDIDKWAKESSSLHTQGLSTIAFGLLAMHEDRLEDGLRYASMAQKIFTEINDEDGIALSQLLFAAFYRTLGNIDSALRYQYSVWNQLRTSGKYPFFQCASSYQLGELYLETNAYTRAIAVYDDCSIAATTINNIAFQALALDGKALAHQALSQDDLAKASFLKALSLLDPQLHTNQLTRVMSDLGTFYLNQNEYAEATRYHQQAMTLRMQNKMLMAAVTNMIQLGKIYLLQNKTEEALKSWQQALDTAAQIDSKPKLSQAHALLSDLYQSQGDMANSLYHYKAYHKTSDEVNKEDGEKKVKRAEMLFAAELTEKENAIIKAQKAEIERKNIELQETIDELTITKVSRRAKALTLLIAIVMIIAEEPIMHIVLHYVGEDNFYFSMSAKIIVVLSLKPIDSGIEHFLLQRIILKKKLHKLH